jgi:hypothetical protein
LSERFKSFTRGIELPSQIFSASIDFLDIESGIFLTYEKGSGVFSPFSSTGLDETTLRRCKISMNTLKENNLIFNGMVIHPSVNKDFLKNLLSRRLWDSIDKLTLLIFSHHDDVFGLLIIFNSTITEKPGFLDIASLLIRNSSEAFPKSRSTLIRNLQPKEISAPVPRAQSAEKIKKDLIELTIDTDAEFPSPIKIAYIDYGGIISSLSEYDMNIDLYAIEFNIFKMYNSMLGENGYIQRISDHCIFMAFLSNLNGNKSLIKNQLNTSLTSLFEKHKLINNPVIYVDDLDLSDNNFSDKLSLFLNSAL